MPEKIVITGLGAICSLGLNVAQTWENLIHGVSGIAPITAFDPSDLAVKMAGEVKNFTPEKFLPAKEVRRRDRYQQLAAVAAGEAIAQSGLNANDVNPQRVGAIISSAVGGFRSLEEAIYQLHDQGPHHLSPFTIPMMMSNGAAGFIGIDHGFKGSAFSVASACASGADGIGIAWVLLRAGLLDAVIAGGSDSTITRAGIASLERTGAMSRRQPPDAGFGLAPQPFDMKRDGLVMSEGSAILVLETESHARHRGAVILAELAGYGSTADAFHITSPLVDGSGGAQAIRNALDMANVGLEDVDYINAHGTGTVMNDISETRAIKLVFGNRAYEIPVSSTKSMTGHMMGATGALEAVICVKTICEGIIPPTIHYQTPDPECDLDYVPNIAREKKVRVAVNNAFGFAGHNAVLVLREYSSYGIA